MLLWMYVPLRSVTEKGRKKIWGPNCNELLSRLSVKSVKTRCLPEDRTGPGRAPGGSWHWGFCSKGDANGSLNYAVPYLKTKVMPWTWLPDVKSAWGDVWNVCKMQVLSLTERYCMVYDQCPAFFFFQRQKSNILLLLRPKEYFT